MAVEKKKLEDRFYKIVLSWDLLRILKEELEKKNQTVDGRALGLTQSELLFEEVKAQITKPKDDDDEGGGVGAIVECSEVEGFHLPTIVCRSTDYQSLSQNDLLLLSTKQLVEGDKKLATATYAFALVDHRQANKVRLRLYLKGEVKGLFNTDEEVEPCPRLSRMLRFVSSEEKKQFYIFKICSLSTIVQGFHIESS